jgi:hypothetical protein
MKSSIFSMRRPANGVVVLATLWLAACSDATSTPDPSSTAGTAGTASTGGGDSGSATTGGDSGTATIGGAGGSAVASAGTGGATPTGGSGGAPGGAAGSSAGQAGIGGSGGGSVVDPGPVKHHVMAMEYPGRLVEISAEGQKLWEHQTPSLTVMFNVLADGHVFYPHGGDAPGAEEIDRNHKVVWSYDSPAGELLGGERLANGNSLLGEGGPPKALELDPAKSVVRSINVTTGGAAHGQIRHIHRLPSGNVLLALEGEGVAREIDATGKTVWEYKGIKAIHEAIRLPNGNTLIGGGESKRLLEVTSAGQIAWELKASDSVALGLVFVASVQVLKNGDLLVCNWLGAGGGAGVHAFQVTRDKKIVWKLDDHQLLKSATTVIALDD